MPQIIENINLVLSNVLRPVLAQAHAADFCVGYFNLRGWRSVADLIEKFEGAAGSRTAVEEADWAIIEQGLQPLPQLLENVVMVFRLMHHRGFAYTNAARAVAERRGLSTVNTIYDPCTRRLELTAAQFRDLATSPTRLHEHLARLYPAFDALLYELLVDAF